MEIASTEEPWRLTAAEALPLLRSGQLKVETYTRSLLERIRKRDSQVKAWVYLSPSQVLENAQKLDELPESERGPLFGLPVAIKDVILTKDMPTQYNSTLYENVDPSGIDANSVMSLRASGALVLGKTSTTEFATSKQGNWHQNLTCNAHDSGRTPGGSSSGSGAAVGDFQVPVAVGTQTGGSIVRPASFNGCYGFKPSWGAISRQGLAQWCLTLDTCGFFCRSVDDLEILGDIFQIQDDDPVPQDPFKLEGAKIGFCKSHNWPNAGPGTKNAMDKAMDILKRHGAIVENFELPDDFSKVLDWHAAVLAGEGRTSFLGQYLMDKSRLHEDIVGHVENKKKISRKQLLEAFDKCAMLRPGFDEIAIKYDVIITPSVVDEAPLGTENTGDMSFCSTWTIMHVPALNIPGFAGENNMPIGLTAVAPRFRDRHLLHVAKTIGPVFEAEGGWFRMNADSEPHDQERRSFSGLRSSISLPSHQQHAE